MTRATWCVKRKPLMANIISVRGKTPVIGSGCFIAPTATIIGDVTLGDGCSVWFGAVLRGDVAPIRLGNNVNVQDNAVIHGTLDKFSTTLGDNVSVGHGAIVHGATVMDNVLIGMGSIVLDGAVVQPDTIIAAGAVLTGGRTAESHGIYAGTPAKRIKELSPEQSADTITRIASHYAEYASWYDDGLHTN